MVIRQSFAKRALCRLFRSIGLICLGVVIAMVLVAVTYKSGRISVNEHPGPPVLFERQSNIVPAGAHSAYYPLNFHPIPLPYEDHEGRGGAMFQSPTATFNINRNGFIYKVEANGMSKLHVDPPFDNAAAIARTTRIFDEWSMGVQSAKLIPVPNGWTLLVSYLETHPELACLQMVVTKQTFSQAELSGSSGSGWEKIFTSESCSIPGKTLIAGNIGGALAVRGAKVYISVGPVGTDLETLRRALADGAATPANQASGRIYEIDMETLEAAPFADGFRNTSGLITGDNDTLWSVEHGPRGGDELNHVDRGEHYGWPLTTYGTDYTGFTWLGSSKPGRHDGFAKPIFAWLPAVAPSALRRIEGRQFPDWAGDIMVSSLKAGHLYRLRQNQGRVVLVEPILIGRRIRDFVEGHDGALYLLLSREGQVLKITAGQNNSNSRGAAVLNLCASCHQLDQTDKDSYSGPTLVGVLGRRVASIQGYIYSDALSQVDGHWTDETLNLFLENPEVYGAGSTMPALGLSFSQRRLVILALEELATKQ